MNFRSFGILLTDFCWILKHFFHKYLHKLYEEEMSLGKSDLIRSMTEAYYDKERKCEFYYLI